ncbi:Ubiquitin fusion degradation protein 1 -like protein [Babesia sp. Xinjiang]|uniref:Ubiquitin fusion degradation protein 1 -like protein n=1 Tax=Babesia sp. Xinjiang TaxID=462227 RepID=UPI000A247F4F|nr:Ubiquitin fusion degradation protein 1 -like protein [Babesia sp. Xinjiang]ORM41745.1 Ubiquitin fusion degradation protein 1 -like protein [Babesia sp. Xinjiang]
MAAWNSDHFDSPIFRPSGYFHNLPFVVRYRCYPVSFIGKEAMECGNKISMPPSALNELASRNISWPMIFYLRNEESGLSTHAGVLEFVSDSGMCHIPYWMMKQLQLKEGDYLTIRNVRLPKANWVKFRPLSDNYWDISNPKAVLETALRNFAALSVGDKIPIHYLSNVYELYVMDLRPSDACCIIETDMEVEFAEPKKKKPQPLPTVSGKRLDGKMPVVRQKEVDAVKPWLRRLRHGIRTTCDEFQRMVRLGSVVPCSPKPMSDDRACSPQLSEFYSCLGSSGRDISQCSRELGALRQCSDGDKTNNYCVNEIMRLLRCTAEPDSTGCAKEFITFRECNRPGGPEIMIKDNMYTINRDHLQKYNVTSDVVAPVTAPWREGRAISRALDRLRTACGFKNFEENFTPKVKI